ncbi:hypothetical protein LTR62_004212 [Meristemomyces frigidus]|uniref:t-SNARE coiled-coil homology domain-containing protein n=1 Tax=Meristemomyces frigidus TaxID=1508187 RepID=A0AAN7YPA8_9PEZI|nr:hypothetical protein LTR62_004212 [Meristemomyces frigidus]
MGWGKKDKSDPGSSDAGLEKQKSSLFGRSSKTASTPAPKTNPYAVAAPSNNPYVVAAPPSNNPYAAQHGARDPYAPPSQSSLTQPSTSSFGSLTLNSQSGGPPPSYQDGPAPNRYDKSPVPQGGYGGGASTYPRNQSGQANGYGSANPYGTVPVAPQSQYGAGGYGGFGGRRGSQETISTDAGRQQLFGDAPTRAQKVQEQSTDAQESGDPSYANSGGYGAAGLHGYGEERELTAEEIEDQEVQGTKDQIRDIKRSDVATTRNALRITEQIEATGRDTLARLGRQGDMLYNAESHLDKTKFENMRSEEKAKELKSLNRSMFAIKMNNPIGKTKRFERDIENEAQKRAHERKTEEFRTTELTKTKYDQIRTAKGLRAPPPPSAEKQRNLLDRTKFQFEADSDDDQMEEELEDNLAQLHKGATMVKKLGQAMGKELETQNAHLERISAKTDKVDDHIARNRARLDRIK